MQRFPLARSIDGCMNGHFLTSLPDLARRLMSTGGQDERAEEVATNVRSL